MTTCDADRLFIKHQNNQLVLHCTGTDTDDLNVNKIRLELTRTIPTLTGGMCRMAKRQGVDYTPM